MFLLGRRSFLTFRDGKSCKVPKTLLWGKGFSVGREFYMALLGGRFLFPNLYRFLGKSVDRFIRYALGDWVNVLIC